jgi:predicted ABC-type ATPase
MISVNIFVGYPIGSDSPVPRLVTKLENLLVSSGIRPEIAFGELDLADKISAEVREKIIAADICIFDISGNVHNVIAEAGWAIGLGKSVVLVKINVKEEEPTREVPSDFADLTRLEVEKSEDLESQAHLDKLRRAVESFARHKHPEDFYLKSLWGLGGKVSGVTIACSQFPEEEAYTPWEDYVGYRRYGDLDSLIILRETIARLYPNLTIETRHAEDTNDLGTGWQDRHLILLGGADVNPLVKHFYRDSPIVYRYDNTNRLVGIYDRLHNNGEGMLYYPKRLNDQLGTVTDYGYFLKRSLHQRGPEKLIVIGGCFTWGVIGATKIFSPSASGLASAQRHARLVVEKLGHDPSFVVIVENQGTRHSQGEPVVNDNTPLYRLLDNQRFTYDPSHLPWDEDCHWPSEKTELKIMPDPQVRLVVITGNASSGKSTVAAGLVGSLPEGWRLLGWDDLEGPAEMLAARMNSPEGQRQIQLDLLLSAVRFWANFNSYNLVVEGILTGTAEVEAIAAAANLRADSPAVRVFYLQCNEETAVVRRKRDRFWEGIHHDNAETFIREHYQSFATSLPKHALEVRTDDLSRGQVLSVIQEELQGHGKLVR